MDLLYRLSNELLLEYNYTNEVKTLVESPIYILNNSNNNSNYFLNDDTQELITKNVRDQSAVIISTGEYAFLNVDLPIPYNDFDSTLTNTNNLSQTITNGSLTYDTIKIHILSGYNFEFSEGFILEAKFIDPFNKQHYLLSFVFDKSSSIFDINPVPVRAEERVYNRFIEIKIPSLKNIIDSFSLNSNDNQNLANVLTDQKGITYQQNLNFNYININKVEDRGGYRYYKVTPENELSIPLEPSFGNLVANIEESSNGDFYQLSAKYDGESVENLLLELNSGSDADWILLHGIDIIEQIVDTGFVLTQSMNLTQVENFEQPIYFRPIILNSEWLFLGH